MAMQNTASRMLQSEADLWVSNLRALRAGVEMRKPDAVARLKLQVERLDREISAYVTRREIRALAGIDIEPMNRAIGLLTARMDDLRAIGDLIRATPLDHDYNCTPEAAVKASEIITGDGECTGEYRAGDPGIDDLADDLKRAASDIRSGWLVIAKRATCAVSGKQPGGDLDSGKPAKLAEQYYHWVRELHRKRMSTWSLDDVVCEGLSRAECAQKRRCYVEKVYNELVAGLTLYAETYPPLGEGHD